MLLEDVEVVAVGMQRCDPAFGALCAVVAVVVVRSDPRHLALAEQAHEAAGERGLAGCGVADAPEEDRAGHQATNVSARSIDASSIAAPRSICVTRGTMSSTPSRAHNAMSSDRPAASS